VTALPPDLRARVLEAARREPSPTVTESRRRAVLLLAVAPVLSLGAFGALGGFHWNREVAVVSATAIGAAAVALGATWAALGRGRSMVGRSRTALLAVALVAPVVFLVWSSLATALSPRGLRMDDGDPLLQHAVCFALTALYAFAPFLAAVAIRRETDPVHPRALGAALGAAAGVWGGVLIDIHCPNDAVLHLALCHLAPIALFALLGAALGARLLGVRPR